KSSAGKKFKDLFDSLTTEREELALLGGSTNLAALEEAKAGLLELQKRIAALEPTEANGGASFDSVVDKLDEEKKELEKVKKKLEENHPKGLKTLNERVTKLGKDIYTQEPATTMKQLTEFAKERVEAVASADKVVEVHKQFKEKLKQVKASLGVFTSRKQAPAYAKSLQKRLDAAAELAEKPDELVRANLQLKTIDEELSKALLEAATALKK